MYTKLCCAVVVAALADSIPPPTPKEPEAVLPAMRHLGTWDTPTPTPSPDRECRDRFTSCYLACEADQECEHRCFARQLVCGWLEPEVAFDQAPPQCWPGTEPTPERAKCINRCLAAKSGCELCCAIVCLLEENSEECEESCETSCSIFYDWCVDDCPGPVPLE
jgi:hypothetical protein